MIVELKNVSIVRNYKYILKDINWAIEEGEHWAIFGLNGAGKTMLLNMVNGYIFPSEGQVRVLGKTLGDYDMRKLRKSIGWVSTAIGEKLHPLSSVLDIVLSGKFATTDLYDEINESHTILAKAKLNSLDALHLLSRKYGTLSQGEKQRVLIARALMAEPSLLILDEPSSGLDIVAKENFLALIEEFANKKDTPSLIYVTHNTEEILPAFKHTLLLKEGKVFSSGPTEKVLTLENLRNFIPLPLRYEKHNGRTYVSIDYTFE